MANNKQARAAKAAVSKAKAANKEPSARTRKRVVSAANAANKKPLARTRKRVVSEANVANKKPSARTRKRVVSKANAANKSQADLQQTWLCLHFTHLGLNSAGIKADSDRASAITIQQQLFQCNHSAQHAGLQAGMSVNHALMLQPEIQLIERDQHQETQKLLKLSHWAYRFTSQVSLYKDNALLLEIGKSINLFKGLDHLINLIDNDLNGFAMDAQYGLAHTPKAAYVLSFEPGKIANQTHSTLAQLLGVNICHLDIEPKTLHQLQHCGFEQLEDLEPIPTAELGRRFGADFLLYLDQLWGRVADPQITTTPPETFYASADFAEPIRNLQWINQQLDRLLQDLYVFTQERQLICRSFTWRFYHENNHLLKTVTIGLSAAQNSCATFRELTDLKLSNLALEWEFASIELSSKQLVPKQLFNNDLFDPKPDQDQFKQLVDKLVNRLGEHALFRVSSASEHLPELANDRRAVHLEHVQEAYPNYHASPHTLKDQPLWLLENPQRLPHSHQHHKPLPLFEGPVTIIHGPDRITSHWWSNKTQCRDYFIARQRNGRLLWVYFDRQEKQWFLHGLFA